MVLIVDSREQNPLTFMQTNGVEIITQMLEVGDYSAVNSKVVVERKSIADLFNSYTSNYDAERAKILRAKDMGLKFILGIEGSATQIRKGHTYWQGGEIKEAKKSGISMIKQLMTVSVKYGVDVWFSEGRRDLAFRIVEYLLAEERVGKEKC